MHSYLAAVRQLRGAPIAAERTRRCAGVAASPRDRGVMGVTDQPLFSVIIPTRNRSPDIRRSAAIRLGPAVSTISK